MILCLQCGAQCAENAAFCSACGSKLPKSALGSALHAEDAAHAAPLPEQSAQYVSIADAEGLTSWLNAKPCPLDYVMDIQEPPFSIEANIINIHLMSVLFNKEDIKKNFDAGIERMYGLHAQVYNSWLNNILGEERAKKYLISEERLKANFQAFSKRLEAYTCDVLNTCSRIRQCLMDMKNIVKEHVSLFDEHIHHYILSGRAIFSDEFDDLLASIIKKSATLAYDSSPCRERYDSQLEHLNEILDELKQKLNSNIHTACEIIKKEQLNLIQGTLLSTLCDVLNTEIKLGTISFHDIKEALSFTIQKEERYYRSLIPEMYLVGISVQQDSEKAYDLYLNLAKENDSGSLAMLGDMHQYGIYPHKNMKKAFAYYKNSAELGNAKGICGLGDCYITGHGVRKNIKNGFELYLKAAKMGDIDAQVAAARCYFKGIGVEQSYAKAYELFKLAAEQCHPEAQRSLGNMYAQGLGVDVNKQEALTLLHRAAGVGDSAAVTQLGYMYQTGDGVEQDKVLAILYYERAADQDDSRAQALLGAMYLNDKDFKDEERACDLLLDAAELGNAYAMYLLAQCYEFGRGIRRNKTKAKHFYKLALDNGCAEAKEGYNRLNAAAKSWFSFLSSSK